SKPLGPAPPYRYGTPSSAIARIAISLPTELGGATIAPAVASGTASGARRAGAEEHACNSKVSAIAAVAAENLFDESCISGGRACRSHGEDPSASLATMAAGPSSGRQRGIPTALHLNDPRLGTAAAAARAAHAR